MYIETAYKKGQFRKWCWNDDLYTKMRFLDHIILKYKFQKYERTNCVRQNAEILRLYSSKLL